MFSLGTALEKFLAHTLTLALVLSCAASATAESRQVAQKVPSNGGVGGADQSTSVELLTPTQGVEFKDYLATMLTIVKRNWYALMPELAREGERGRVHLRFHIQQNGTITGQDPSIEKSSGKETLDRAAVAAVRSSVPFPPLPAAFHGRNIEVRFIFRYNLPLKSAHTN